MNTTINYATLMDQINELTKKAEVLRVVEDIQTKIQQYGLTPNDLGFDIAFASKKVVHTRRKPDAKYKDPITGATWSGRGKLPTWMQASISQGMSKEQFAIS
jgi:DNA-binding protein H-NS